ncbi:FAD-dependent monooxygenase [Marinomonas sp. 15G1-11]|uniref:FAD-dependent monooxygenase n=1 Tax=Marinomonas phaeophyticola TaxID=3004091 RepID=A0ABT4JS64_9GAMM|nr:FAD-dependent monooxygenase [Marinomonas sp. 15G1-11]MCZ2721016.1 FAD-dependent monooxygenase [Marinomonas sp. 15G1-11]
MIVGGGIGGLCAALSLTKQGFLVSVFEQSKSLGEVGAGLQMTPNAMKVLTALGLLEQIKKVSFSPENAVIRHYQTGKKFLNVPLGEGCCSRYNAPYLHLHRADLHRILLAEAKGQGVIFHLNSKVVQFEQDDRQVSITMESGETFSGSMLIGADGIRSKVLEQLQKSLSFQCNHKPPIFTGQVAWRGTIATDLLPKGLIKPDATVWAGPGRHFVTYYLRGGKMVNFVAVEERSQWTNESWNTAGDVEQLKSAFSGWHSEVTQLLAAADETFLWGLFAREPLSKWHLNRVVLLGDACHPMLPFMAQGAAMAIEDAFVLAKELSGVVLENSQNVEQALTRYTHQRLPRTSKVQAMSKANADLYHMKGGALGRLRLNTIGMVTSTLPSVVNVKLDPVYGLDVTQ